VLIVGFATVLLLMAAGVVDASAAYLHRQGLDSLADGAALAGADGGAQGTEAYRGGFGERARLDPGPARAAVGAYLAASNARARFPGLRYDVQVEALRVVVRVRAPIDLPLTVPGSPDRPVIGAVGSAVVTLDRDG
jgi:hypothetical protein